MRGARALGVALWLLARCALAHAAPADSTLAALPDSALAAAPVEAAAVAPAAPASGEGLLVSRFPETPLAPPLVVTGMFGERRPRHFHGGLDLSTGGAIGQPVRAPIDGWIERVRTQGVGYGRSFYLHSVSGLSLVFGHLDAFAEPIASYLAAVQDSSGQYEQDLWPPKDRFPVKAGQVLGWSGKSGTGEPHLHIEVRRGDEALNPLRAGIPVADDLAPDFRTVTIEPLDEGSLVEGAASPLTRPLGAREETLMVVGRLRALARAVDPGLRGGVLAPWRLRSTWEGAWVEWCADSASWATDMVDVDYVYDVGRAIAPGAAVIQLWAPPRWRPAVLRTNVPDSLAAGLIVVRPGDPARPLRFEVTDVAGHRRERTLWLRGPRENESAGAATSERPLARAARLRASRRAFASGPGGFRYDGLPQGALRVRYRGAPADLESATLLGVSATRRGTEWCAIVPAARFGDSTRPAIRGARKSGAAWADSARPMAVARGGREPRVFAGPSAFQWSLQPRDVFEPATLLFDVVGRPATGGGELVALSDEFAIEPADLPLRAAMSLRLESRRGPVDPRAGLYVRDDGGWSYVGGRDPGDPARVAGNTRVLGRFAMLADTVAPRLRVLRAPRRAPSAPYSQWALRARWSEAGSGLDARGTFFTVDGRRVPTECDGVRSVLVWRPLARPARGTHHYTVEARDRAGNVRQASGTFVLD